MANVIAAQNDFYISNKWVPARTPRRRFRLSKVLTGGGEREREREERYYKISVVPLQDIVRSMFERHAAPSRKNPTNLSARDLAAISLDRREDKSGREPSWMKVHLR